MRFWDVSALVPLLVNDQTSANLAGLYRADPQVIAWWGSPVECVSALARMEREGKLDAAAMSEAIRRITEMCIVWDEIQPLAIIRDLAVRLLRTHTLRAADSLQLAAATVASKNRPASLDFVCLDKRLSLAAQREGFNVIIAEARQMRIS
jgi:predicted nucleic acid-binding protein